MELRQLRYFVAVAEMGNISRAAQKIFLTQPALSRQIKGLEEEMGQCLLERQANSIKLTAAGEALLIEARDLLARAEGISARIREASQTARLRVGFAPSLASGPLSAAVQSFAQKHPQARVELFDLSTKEMLAGLERGELDVALTVRAARDGHGVTWTPLLRSPWQLAVNEHHALARRTRVTAKEIAGESLLAFCQRDYPEYWKRVTDWLREKGLRVSIATEFDGVNSLMSAVESGMGVAIVTSSAGRLAPKRVRLKTLVEPPEPLCIAAGHRTDRASEKTLGVFIEELKNAAQAFA